MDAGMSVAEPPPLAALVGVERRFGAAVALGGVDLQVGAGEVLAVLGPNGAGKTTAIALLLGLLTPDAGEVRLFGRSPLEVAARRQVGVLMQDVSLPPNLTVRELIDQVASYYPDPLPLEETIALAGVGPIAGKRYGKLSGGQKRQAQFALALCGRPRLLFLDEPTANLDAAARQTLWAAVRRLAEGGVAVVLTTHYIEEAEALADRVAVLAQGRVIAGGTVAQMRAAVVRQHIACASQLDEAAIRAIPAVTEVRREGHRLRLTVADAEAVARRLLEADPTLHELEVSRASLSEAIAILTGAAADDR